MRHNRFLYIRRFKKHRSDTTIVVIYVSENVIHDICFNTILALTYDFILDSPLFQRSPYEAESILVQLFITIFISTITACSKSANSFILIIDEKYSPSLIGDDVVVVGVDVVVVVVVEIIVFIIGVIVGVINVTGLGVGVGIDTNKGPSLKYKYVVVKHIIPRHIVKVSRDFSFLTCFGFSVSIVPLESV